MVFTMCHVCLSGEFLWLDDLLHAHPQFGNILYGALLPSVMIESLRRRSANGPEAWSARLAKRWA